MMAMMVISEDKDDDNDYDDKNDEDGEIVQWQIEHQLAASEISKAKQCWTVLTDKMQLLLYLRLLT